ncbi:MAG: bifunctional acetate--CoA ligase family protein/GNAT family N-acetyltransferase [Gammaproteobacteria bacterium]
MSVRNLEALLRPRSVAVVGASTRPRSIGNLVMQNLLEGGFQGPVLPVNPKYGAVAGVLAYPTVESLPEAPDLAVICTPPSTIPGLISELGERGTRAAIVMTAGLRETPEGNLVPRMLEAARPHVLRILGPNCLGLIAPGIHLNASFAHQPAAPGKIAFVSQSGALCTSVLDWAKARGIGFSHFISIGESADVDVGDLLDYLGADPATSAILLYLESITERRKFMSAGRAAARVKPVLVIKSGRGEQGARAAHSHTGALAGSDVVFDAAIRRAGMLRVYSFNELFGAVETLARGAPVKGERLAIVTNGGGPGVMAVDELTHQGGRLAELAPETIEALDGVLPRTWSRANPVDLIGDAPGRRYREAIRILMKDKGVDAVLVMHAPTAVSSATEVAEEVIKAVEENGVNRRRAVLTNWLGDDAVSEARQRLASAGLRTYRTPETAVRAFLHMLEYRRNQESLMETPPSVPEDFEPDLPRARGVVERVLARGESILTEPEAKEVLRAYGVPVVETQIARNPMEAGRLAVEFGAPVALKILSHDITHKSDVGGVVLDLEGERATTAAAEAMIQRVHNRFPQAQIEGFTVQKMVRRAEAWELVVGATTDALFGPVILFGQGGTAVELIRDSAIALPPLNLNLARELMSRTRIYRLLEGYRDHPPADLQAVSMTLLRVSQLLVDIPEIIELDINPLLADANGVVALDARVVVAEAEQPGASRLAIRPYPKELEDPYRMNNGREVLIRPIRPEDEPEHHVFISRLTPEDIRFRFFGLVREIPHSQMARLTQIDYDREMAFIATGKDSQGNRETLGVVRTATDPDNLRAEFAIVVRSDLKGLGLGKRLLTKMIDYCRSRGTVEMVGQILSDNRRMLSLARSLGFVEHTVPGEQAVEVCLTLNGVDEEAAQALSGLKRG